MAITYNTQVNSLYAASVASDAAYQSPGTYGIPRADLVGSISSVTVVTPGSGNTSIPTVAFNAGGGSGALATARMKVVSATIAAAGTGGTPGTQTVTGTTGTGTKFTASVTVSGGGAITAVLSITLGGVYSVMPSSLTNEPVTGASLTGAQLALSMGVDSVVVSNAGVDYNPATTVVAFSSVSGVAATATPVFSNPVETRMLTLIEVIRSYVASCQTSAELYATRDIVREMMGRIYGGNGTASFSAANLASSVQRAGVLKFAKQARPDF